MGGYSIPKNFEEFKKSFDVEILNLQKCDSIPFKCILKNVPPIFHQSIRKVICKDVPSIAIDRIYGYEFGNFIDVENIVKLIGLVPVDVNPDKLIDHKYLPETDNITEFNSNACLYFKVDVFSNSEKRFVYSNDLKWMALNNQNVHFSSSDINIVENIFINVLTKNERLRVNCLAVKGYGWDHAKFKPDCCAVPRPKPVLTFDQIKNNDAKLFKSLFADGVIKIVRNEAVVDNIWKLERLQKNASNYSQFDGKFEFDYDDSEYMWKIESVRPINQPAQDIFYKAIDVIIEKCQHYSNCLEKMKEFIASSSTGLEFKSPEKLISGRNRYITTKDLHVSDSPLILFHNEDDSITQSLVYIVRTMYKIDVICSDTQSGSDVVVRCDVMSADRSKMDGCKMLLQGFCELIKYYRHIQTSFKNALMEFIFNSDVEMK